MAEKATNEETFVFALTYNDETQESRDAAKTFVYKDIKDFMKRLRQAIYRKTKQRGQLRFIVAGENGSKKGRCHWHIVLYSQVDLLSFGKWSHWWTGKPVQREDVKAHSKKHKRINWTLWKSGFVSVQEPDQGGMEYALSYALKHQFNIENSQGTMRETKSEHWASGYFSQSRRPPIALNWLKGKLDSLLEKNAVPHNLEFKIQDYKGYWHPTGLMRDYLLRTIWENNEIIEYRTGKRAPQMAALLASVVDQQKDWEILQNGKIIEQDSFTDEEFSESVAAKAANAGSNAARERIRYRCGAFRPCRACYDALESDEQDAINKFGFEIAIEKNINSYEYEGEKALENVDNWFRGSFNINNTYCALKETKGRLKAFSNFA
ncbi:MAG: hypothetical protein JKY31_08330 [Rhodobacteraceae bacterium]|nr:hypothetical protein [Paracoccaceae bacterium]